MEWIGLPDNIDDYYSIIYLITDITTNKKYIGKKQLHSTIKKPPLKGYKRKRIITKPSDYLTYYGSSEELKRNVSQFGTENYKREVLDVASCKWEAAYLELLYQLKYNVITSEEYLNGILNVRLVKTPKHLKSKYENFWIDFGFNNDKVMKND